MRRGGNNRTNAMTLVLPVCIAIIILVIIVKAIMGSSSSSKTNGSETPGTPTVQVIPKKDAKVSIYMSSDAQTELKGPSKLYPNDKMVKVDSGDADIEIEGSTSKIAIESLSELHYDGLINGKHTFTVGNGYVWVDSPNGDVVIKLKLFTVTPDKGTVFIAYQNTRSSNAYILKGSTTASTDAATASVGSNQMLSLLLSEAKNTNITDQVAVIDDFIKQSSIFIKKDGASVLTSVGGSAGEMSSSGSVGGSVTSASGSTSSSTTNSKKAITFTYPEDEMSVDTQTVNIEGKINNPSVAKIVIGKKEAQILKEDKSFRLKDYALPDASNDISYKVFDDSGVKIDQGIITVNVSGKKATPIKKPDVVNYPVSNKDFKITSPLDNPYKTTETSVKLKGSFAPNIVKFIKVNNYQLQQFKAFGTSWSYNASIDNGNMEEGVNEYLITYYGPSDEVLATTKVYVVKESSTPVITPAPTTTTPPATGTGSAKPSL